MGTTRKVALKLSPLMAVILNDVDPIKRRRRGKKTDSVN